MALDGFNVYLVFIGVKNHFYQRKYDYWKYCKTVSRKITESSFNKRNDHSFFHILGKNFKNNIDLENFFIANFKYGIKYVADMVKQKEECMSNYGEHMKIIDALQYKIPDDMQLISTKRRSNPKYIIGGDILKDVRQGKILLETLCFFDVFYNLFTYYDKIIKDTLYVQNEQLFLKKYVVYIKNIVDKKTMSFICTTYKKILFEGELL